MTTLTVYARKEPTTDLKTLNYIKETNPQAKRFDVQIYTDKQAITPLARFPWYYQNKPTAKQKTVFVNCFKYNLEWI